MRESTRTICLAAALSLALAGPAAAATMPDAWVTTKVKMGLMTSEGLTLANAAEIDVDTNDGRVTLHGTVASAEAKTQAEQVARGIEGVREVRNLITVGTAPAAATGAAVSDEELETRVKAALAEDQALKESRIEVQSVDEGVVVLGGEARSLSAARRAIEDASEVEGVRRVRSEIESPDRLGENETWREGAYDAADYAGSAARDLWITSAAKVRLLANADTPAFDINVDTDDQVVTLFGTVHSEEAKRQAEAEVRKVDGVRDVENDLQVVSAGEAESTTRSDEQLDEAVQQKLAASERLGEADIDVQVENGVARLTGSVASRSDHVAALSAARSVQGVRRVIDDLKLDEAPAVGAR
jgi:hyperosmotically inducible protein